MKVVYLLRAKSDGKQTLGAWVAQMLNEVFVAKSLELAWSNNQNNISCIPVNNAEIPYYLCRWTRSNRLSREKGEDVYTYEILGVPNRAGIRLHSANYFYQLLGCVAIGDSHKDINMDGQLDTIHSGNTVNEFNRLMNGEDFKLIVTNINEDIVV